MGLNLANNADLAAWNAAKALYTNAIGGAGGVYDWKQGNTISANSLSWLISPSYKLTDTVMLYGSASQGEKSGAVEFVHRQRRAAWHAAERGARKSPRL